MRINKENHVFSVGLLKVLPAPLAMKFVLGLGLEYSNVYNITLDVGKSLKKLSQGQDDNSVNPADAWSRSTDLSYCRTKSKVQYLQIYYIVLYKCCTI